MHRASLVCRQTVVEISRELFCIDGPFFSMVEFLTINQFEQRAEGSAHTTDKIFPHLAAKFLFFSLYSRFPNNLDWKRETKPLDLLIRAKNGRKRFWSYRIFISYFILYLTHSNFRRFLFLSNVRARFNFSPDADQGISGRSFLLIFHFIQRFLETEWDFFRWDLGQDKRKYKRYPRGTLFELIWAELPRYTYIGSSFSAYSFWRTKNWLVILIIEHF